MKLHIEKLSTKQITTSKGPAIKVGIRYNDKWYSCFRGRWNESWKEGDTIDVEVVQKGDFLNILPPKEAQAPRVDWAREFKVLNEKLDRLLAGKAPAPKQEALPPPPKDEDMPPDQEEIDQQAEDMF